MNKHRVAMIAGLSLLALSCSDTSVLGGRCDADDDCSSGLRCIDTSYDDPTEDCPVTGAVGGKMCSRECTTVADCDGLENVGGCAVYACMGSSHKLCVPDLGEGSTLGPMPRDGGLPGR